MFTILHYTSQAINMNLPGVAQELADVLGRERALYLIGQLPRCYPAAGRNGTVVERVILYVPKRLTPDHCLVRILGWQDAQRLAVRFGGCMMTPPTCRAIYREFRDLSILRLLENGIDKKTLAEWFEVSERHIQEKAKVAAFAKSVNTPANDNTARQQ